MNAKTEIARLSVKNLSNPKRVSADVLTANLAIGETELVDAVKFTRYNRGWRMYLRVELLGACVQDTEAGQEEFAAFNDLSMMADNVISNLQDAKRAEAHKFLRHLFVRPRTPPGCGKGGLRSQTRLAQPK